jgi:hypothetical protein
MNINSSVSALTDELSDYVGIKSGLGITAANVVQLLDRDLASTDESDWWYSPKAWLHQPPQSGVRIRAEDMESLVMRLLHAVGALPSPWSQMQLVTKFWERHPDIIMILPKDPDEDEFPFPVPPWTRLAWYAGSAGDLDMANPLLADFVLDFRRRTILEIMFDVERSEWDGVVALRELFGDGLAPEAKESFETLIDQRFIDYLHAQPEDVSQVHWRQFELLVAEFFRRHGYQVQVTPPSGDGGIDVRAHRSSDSLGPELVLVQAKRYSSDRTVGVETVKALWSDINEANATRGVIATTSTLAPGARAYCEARRYRLSAAEAPTVQRWLRDLATHPRSEK